MAAIEKTFASSGVATAGEVDAVSEPLIDHNALGPELSTRLVWAWPNDVGGVRMSDHSGGGVEVRSGPVDPRT